MFIGHANNLCHNNTVITLSKRPPTLVSIHYCEISIKTSSAHALLICLWGIYVHLCTSCLDICVHDNGWVVLLSPSVPAECPVNSTVSGCSTCCCASSDNVEFYVPSMGEPDCTAPAAVYEARFVATWTSSCHPDYYFSSAHWSPLTGISHKPEYELWDACMYNVSLGVATVSQTGSTCKLVLQT